MDIIDKLLLLHEKYYSINLVNRQVTKKYRKKSQMIPWVYAHGMFILAQWLLYFVLKLKYKYDNRLPICGGGNLAVSLTSYPPRIGNLWMTIHSLFRQTILPGHIVLYLSHEDFPKGKEDLPETLLWFEYYGLEIKFVEDNIRSHKKYYYMMQEHPDWDVITVDDDIYYRKDLVEQLLRLHSLKSKAVCANQVAELPISKEDFANYASWKSCYLKKPNFSYRYVAIGCGGILYPSGIFHFSDQVFDKECILENALSADDLWLKAHEINAGVGVMANTFYSCSLLIPSSQASALYHVNCEGENKNNKVWRILSDIYKLRDKIQMLCDKNK